MSFTLEMIVIGGLTGILSGLLGVGGGFIMIPLLNAAGLLMSAGLIPRSLLRKNYALYGQAPVPALKMGNHRGLPLQLDPR